MRIAGSILDVIGNTPLIRLNRVVESPAQILVKAEFLNPGGSIKDRIGLALIEDALKDGRLRKAGTIVEPTSGNTGVGLCLAAAVNGLKTLFVVPDKVSSEKIKLLQAYGAEVVKTPTEVPAASPQSFYSVARQYCEKIPGAFMPNQYANPKNPGSHYSTTGPEIWRDTDGKVTHLIAGMGTGGTITGTARYLKEKNPAITVIGVDPEGSVLSGDSPRPYKVEGIGEDFFPSTLDLSVIDKIVRVSDRDSFIAARRLAREEGILAGGSSGAAIHACMTLLGSFSKSDVVVVILPDSGRGYLDKMFSDDWMRQNRFLD